VQDNALDSVTGGADEDTLIVKFGTSYTLVTDSDIENVILGIGLTNITGNNGANKLTGNDGANILNGGDGIDNLYGGRGNDTYIVDAQGEAVEYLTIAQGGGIDLVKSRVDYTLGANLDNLTLTNTALTGKGNELANTLIGNDGDNVLTGAGGKDVLTGGKGNDTYYIDLSRTSMLPTSALVLQDTINELANEGIDNVMVTNINGGADGGELDIGNITTVSTLLLNTYIENFDVSLTGNIKLNVTGNANYNNITGNNADNTLKSGLGNDQIDAGAGNDIIFGNEGADRLIGGTGNDRFSYNSSLESQAGEAKRDVIIDFTGGEDFIDLSLIDANILTIGNQAFVFVGNEAFNNNQAGQIRLDATSSLLQADTNGDNVADFEILLTGISSLTNADFVL
jgi:Ca2+-binding RTX toxin-like protein